MAPRGPDTLEVGVVPVLQVPSKPQLHDALFFVTNPQNLSKIPCFSFSSPSHLQRVTLIWSNTFWHQMFRKSPTVGTSIVKLVFLLFLSMDLGIFFFKKSQLLRLGNDLRNKTTE